MHLTVANLNNKFAASLEAPVAELLLKAIFNDEEKFRRSFGVAAGSVAR
ncbi:N-succinylarginine dihydrolase [Escherichia coli]